MSTGNFKWEMPREISPDELRQISVETCFYDQNGHIDPEKREESRKKARQALTEYSVAFLTGFYESIPGGMALLDAAEKSRPDYSFTEAVALNVAERGVILDQGDRSKLMCVGIKDDTHPVSKALEAVAREYLPGFVVARGMDTSGTPCTERVALLQTKCANHEALRGAGIDAAVIQILHTDKEIYYEPQRGRSRDKTPVP